MIRRFFRFTAVCGPALTGLALLAAGPASGATVDFRFEPPEVPPEHVCVVRSADADVIAKWTKWDGYSLAGQDPVLVRSEMRRLREINGAAWFDKINAAILLLPTIDPGFSADHATLERIDTMLAAGKLRDLQASQLVPQLLQEDHGDSPRVQLALSRYLTLGQGVERDPKRGLDLLVSAALGGNADALLELVSHQVNGETVAGWDLSPDLAVTMAFGALVGKLDPGICDRVTRIAREYKNGDIVTGDMAMAERWYRFAADLGDTDAAWKVAELHMKSDELIKDNTLLVKYLERAADGGAPFAMIALGRAYEIGAIVPQDRARARGIYQKAASSGDRGALIRLALLLSKDEAKDAEAAAAYQAVLTALATRDDAPAWAYIEKANEILAAKGRWAGEAEARGYLERAAEIGDGNAMVALAGMNFRTATDPQTFYDQIDEMIYGVSELGMNDPAADLFDAFTCRAPAAPQATEAALWREVEESKASKTVSFDYAELQALAARPDTQKVAMLQSQALYGRATATAQYMTYLEIRGAPADQLAFWQDYSRRFAKVDFSRGRLLLESGIEGDVRQQALDLLRNAVEDGDVSAGLPLANALLNSAVAEGTDGTPTPSVRAEALALLEPVAQLGNGEAMTLLLRADPEKFPTLVTVFDAYAETIDARGDFDAILLALPYIHDTAKRQDYIARATAITNCSFEQVVAFTDLMGRLGDRAGFAKWSTIATSLLDDDGWQMTELGDKLRLYGTPEQMARGYDLYDEAHQRGNRTAAQRLLALATQAGQREYDAPKAAALYAELLEDATPDEMVKLLRRIDGEDPEVRELALAKVSPVDFYLKAAEGGNAVAMREYARLLQASAQSPAEVETAVMWMARAAENEDAPAMLEYAQMLAFGAGVPASREDALFWLQKAADKGLSEANVMIQTLNLAASQ